MPSLARIGDLVSCGDHVGTGSSNIFMNGMPVARQGDITTGHCFPPVPFIGPFSNTVFCNNLPIVLTNITRIPEHCCDDDDNCHDGVVISGSPDVFVE